MNLLTVKCDSMLLFFLVHIRTGWPCIFLRSLCLPTEWRNDEHFLYLWSLPQVSSCLPWALPCSSREKQRSCQFMCRVWSFVFCSWSFFVFKTSTRKLLFPSLICCPWSFYVFLSSIFSLLLSSGSRLGGIVSTLCFFFNHGEVSMFPLTTKKYNTNYCEQSRN